MQGYAGVYRDMQEYKGNVGVYMVIQGYSGVYRGMQGYTGRNVGGCIAAKYVLFFCILYV